MTKKPQVRKNASARPWELPDVSEADRLNHWIGDPSFMLSLARGMLVLHAVADGGGESQSIAEIVRDTGLSRATVRRCLYTLNAIGYVRAARSGGAPGPRLAALTASNLKASPLLSSSRPILDRLRDEIRQTITLAIREHSEAVYIAHSHSDAFFKIDVPIGVRFPLYCTSVGRIFLADLPQEQLSDYLKVVELKPLSERTITSKGELLKHIDEVRRKGYSIVDQEVEIGLRSVAAPVRDRRGNVIAALSVGTHMAVTGPRELRGKILPAMVSAAIELSSLIP